MVDTALDYGDIIIIIVYFVLCMAVGLWVSLVDAKSDVLRFRL